MPNTFLNTKFRDTAVNVSKSLSSWSLYPRERGRQVAKKYIHIDILITAMKKH